MKPKVVYIVSDLEFALAIKWLIEQIDRNKIDLHFILIHEKKLSSELENLISKKEIPYDKLIVRQGKIAAAFSVLRLALLLRQIQPDAIHCHMRRANLLGLMAGKLTGVKRRIFTRHYSTQNHQYYPKAVKIDKLLNKLATIIVAPSRTVQSTLVDLENVPTEKVRVIPHGFDLEYFAHPDAIAVEALKIQLELQESGPVVGVISRFLELKGLQYIIPAFAEFEKSNPGAVLVLANAHGPYESEVNKLLAQLPEKSWRKVRFEKNLSALYACFDYFVHAPIEPSIEAFGQIYIEALAAGVPSVFTLSGIAHEFIEHEKNALVVPHAQSEPIAAALLRIHEQKELQSALIACGHESITPYGLKTFIDHTIALYV